MMVKDPTPIKLRSVQQLGWLDYSIDIHCLGKFRVRKDHSQKQESLGTYGTEGHWRTGIPAAQTYSGEI